MEQLTARKRDVFISHSSQDKLVADAICDSLEGQGLCCWIAARDIRPGEDWSDAIIDAITDCRIFMLILSGASNHSEQVKREIQNAVMENRSILPVRIEDVALSKHMRYFIGTPHWLDAMPPPIERHLLRLTGTVMQLAESLACPAPARETVPPSALPADEGTFRLPAAPAQPVPVHPFSPDLIASAEKALAHFVGPLARVLVKRAARESLTSQELFQRLSAHLATPAEKKSFLQTVQSAGKTQKMEK